MKAAIVASMLAAFVLTPCATAQSPELLVQTGHKFAVISVAFSPDGRTLASGSDDKTINLWDVASGRELRSLDAHTGEVRSVAFSPDGKLLAAGGWPNTITIWDVTTGRELRTLVGHSVAVNSVAFSPDGRLLASGGMDDLIKLWDVAGGRELRSLAGHKGAVLSVTFSPDGSTLASGSVDHTVRLWEVASGKELRSLDTQGERVESVALSPDGRRVAAAIGGTVSFWDLTTEGGWRRLPRSGWTTAVAFSPDGRTLASANAAAELGAGESADNAVRLWDVASGKQLRNLTGHVDQVGCIAFSPDGRTLASGSVDHTVRLWDAADGQQLRTLDGHLAAVFAVAFSPKGRVLASGGADDSVKLWDMASGRQLGTLVGHSNTVLSLAFSPDGLTLASGSEDSTIKLWDVASERQLRTLPHAQWVNSIAFSPNGRTLAAGNQDTTIKLWDVATGRESQVLAGHHFAVFSVAFSPKGRVLASASPDRTVKLWDVASGQNLGTLVGRTVADFYSVTFSPDGRMLAAGSTDKTTRLWETASWAELNSLGGSTSEGFSVYNEVWSVAFSPDGKTLASGNGDGSIELWSVPRGRKLRSLAAHSHAVKSLVFSPDGRLLVSGSQDGSLRIWNPASGELLATLISVSGRPDWLVVTPDGLFDGSPAAWDQILWRFNGNTFDVAPVEVFFREFYYPGLLADILAGKRPRATTDIAAIDRRQPQVKLSLAGTAAEAEISERRVKVEVQVQEAPADKEHPTGSGAQDVRLFRNGSLVHIWHGDVLAGKKQAALQAEVTLVAGENKLTAYAFSDDNVKSTDATLTLTGAESLQRPGTAYILAVGINQYADPDFNLRYAAADAEDFSSEIAAQQQKLGRYAQVEVTALENEQATKANLLAALKHLAEMAQPEDAVFIYYAGHGTAAAARFYLIPHDLGYAGTRNDLDEAAVKQVLAHSVSDLELDQAFEGIDAGEMVLVIDACRSGQALQADDPRQGPMNSKGLAQLAYEKGMYILTASQGYQAALEASSYGHGLLTYALVEEGLKAGKADDQPKDGEVTLREWLDYAGQEVPQLELEMMQAARTRGMEISIVEGEQKVQEVEKRSLQRPRVFYRREPEAEPFVVAKP